MTAIPSSLVHRHHLQVAPSQTNSLAGQEYYEFGQDIKQLAQPARALDQVFERTYNYLNQEAFGLPGHLAPQWDRASFLDIVGDYEATVRECERLLETNRQYSSSAGPYQNITWHMFVRDDVERLRTRIQFHHVKMQHFLAPFEMYVHHVPDHITAFANRHYQGHPLPHAARDYESHQ